MQGVDILGLLLLVVGNRCHLPDNYRNKTLTEGKECQQRKHVTEDLTHVGCVTRTVEYQELSMKF